MGRPLRLVLVNDVEVIVHGLAAMLAPFRHRVSIVDVELGDDADVDARADVALFDTYGSGDDVLRRAGELADERLVDHVVLYTWQPSRSFAERAAGIGASAVLSKALPADQLVGRLERVVAGERLGLEPVHTVRADVEIGLSPRELEVLRLVALGRTNRAIADALYLSVDTVKTYVQRVFQKLGVTNRTMAAVTARELGIVDHRPHDDLAVNHPNG